MSFARYFSTIGGDFSVYQTVATLKSLIRQSLTDPDARIRRRAESLLYSVGERDAVGEIQAIYHFVVDSLHYVSDPDDIELLKNPIWIDEEVTRQGYFMGDCDDASGYLAALLKSVGYPAQLVIVTPDRAPSFDYGHIFVRVWGGDSLGWIALDPTAKAFPMGWEVPNKKERVYDL